MNDVPVLQEGDVIDGADKEAAVDDLCVRVADDGGVPDGGLVALGALGVRQGEITSEGTAVGGGERKHFRHRPCQVLGRPRLLWDSHPVPAVHEPLAGDIVH